jgi:uncharacterized membrane protein YdcZ (DUF606 family)
VANEAARPNRFAIGCLLLPPGFFGGAMIALGIGLVVDRITGCKVEADQGATVCNAGWYILVGGLLGVIVLQAVVQWRLRRQSGATVNSDRS